MIETELRDVQTPMGPSFVLEQFIFTFNSTGYSTEEMMTVSRHV